VVWYTSAVHCPLVTTFDACPNLPFVSDTLTSASLPERGRRTAMRAVACHPGNPKGGLVHKTSNRISYLQPHRNGTYWFRFRVPKDVQAKLGSTEIHHSLGTKDRKTAIRELPIALQQALSRIDAARNATIPRPVRRYARYASYEYDENTVLSDDQLEHLASKCFIQGQRIDQSAFVDAETLQQLLKEHDPDPAQVYSGPAITILQHEGIRCSSASVTNLARFISSGETERQRRLISRGEGTFHRSDVRWGHLHPGTPLPNRRFVTLGDLIKQHSANRSEQNLASKSQLKRDAQYALFKEVIGSTTLIDSIDRQVARTLEAVLFAFPPNATKCLTIDGRRDIIEAERKKIIAGEVRSEQPLMNARTINTYLAAFSKLMTFAENEHLIKENPAKGLRCTIGRQKKSDGRQAFSNSEMKRIFNSPIYVGCQDDGRGYSKPGPNRPRNHRFWIPLIGLYSGMRLQEICQLQIRDIGHKDGMHFIDVNDDAEHKSLKTRNATRAVPVHPELIKIGLLSYVASQRQNGEDAPLFPHLTKASTGYLSDNFSKWFANFLDSVAIVDRRKTFHSFRHGFRDLFRDAGIFDPRILVIGGWAFGGMEEHYGQGFKPAQLAEALNRLEIPDLDLSHLHAEGRSDIGIFPP